MKFRFVGQYSGGLEVHSAMGVGFRGREPSSEVTDPAAISWLSGHPSYEVVAEEPEPKAAPKRRPRKAK